MVRWLRHVVEKTVYAVCTINRINLAAVHDGCVFCSFSKTTIEKIKFISHFLISFVFIENIEREKSEKKIVLFYLRLKLIASLFVRMFKSFQSDRL